MKDEGRSNGSRTSRRERAIYEAVVSSGANIIRYEGGRGAKLRLTYENWANKRDWRD